MHQKLLLKAVLAEFQRSGVEEAVFWRILEQLEGIYTLEGENINHYPLNSTEVQTHSY